jgi:hypothetical protein
MPDDQCRAPLDVFNDHLDLSQQGRFEEDVSKNFAEDCVVLTNRGSYRGHAGLKTLATMLKHELPNAKFNYINKMVEGRFAFLEWTADCGDVAVHDGADSFVIEDGKVVAQTIHYTLNIRRALSE